MESKFWVHFSLLLKILPYIWAISIHGWLVITPVTSRSISYHVMPRESIEYSAVDTFKKYVPCMVKLIFGLQCMCCVWALWMKDLGPQLPLLL